MLPDDHQHLPEFGVKQLIVLGHLLIGSRAETSTGGGEGGAEPYVE